MQPLTAPWCHPNAWLLLLALAFPVVPNVDDAGSFRQLATNRARGACNDWVARWSRCFDTSHPKVSGGMPATAARVPFVLRGGEAGVQPAGMSPCVQNEAARQPNRLPRTPRSSFGSGLMQAEQRSARQNASKALQPGDNHTLVVPDEGASIAEGMLTKGDQLRRVRVRKGYHSADRRSPLCDFCGGDMWGSLRR